MPYIAGPLFWQRNAVNEESWRNCKEHRGVPRNGMVNHCVRVNVK